MPASYLQEQLPGPLGYLLVTSAPRSGITLGRSQGTQEGQSPNARSPRDLHQQHHAHPPQPAALHEVLVGGADRVSVDALGGDLLPPPPDRKSTRLNSSHANISYAVFCLKKKTRP